VGFYYLTTVTVAEWKFDRIVELSTPHCLLRVLSCLRSLGYISGRGYDGIAVSVI